MSNSVVTIILGRWVATMDRDDPPFNGPMSPIHESDLVISHGAVAIKDNRIVGVGKASDIQQQFQSEATEVCDLSVNHIIIPGLINCHTHAAMSLLRGYADDLSLQDWLEKYIWPTEAKLMSDEFVYEGTAIALVEAIRTGTTMMNDMYHLPESSMRAFRESGIRCVTGPALIDFGDGTIEKQFQASIDFIKSHSSATESEDNLVRPSFAPHAMYTVDESWHRRGVVELQTTLKDKHVVYHTHVHESEKELASYKGKTGKTAIQSLYDAGALNERFVGAHCVHLTDGEIELLAQTKANVCHCPKSNLKTACGFCQVGKLIKAGVNVCLGTDGACSNNSVDMLSEMQVAALLAKAVSKDSRVVDAYTALKMATRNGARALGRIHDLGSLEVGKLADVVAIDIVGDVGLGHPIYDPISHLVYTTHIDVTDVWVNGKRIMKASQIQTIKLDLKRLDNLINKIAEIRENLISANHPGQ